MHCSFFCVALMSLIRGLFKISVVFCGQKVVFAAQERLSSLRNKHIH